MSDFFKALIDPDIPFLRYALLVGLLSSISLGVVGSYVVTRRITYIAAAIAHCVLGGIGAALYLDKVIGWTWCDPMYGATAAAILSALIIGLVSLYAKQREDTVISAVWAMGMAVGVLFFAKTPGLRRSDELSVRRYPADFPARFVDGCSNGYLGGGGGLGILPQVSRLVF